MSLTLYALFPEQYVPAHTVLATRPHKPDGATEIIRSDGRKTSKVTKTDAIIRAMKDGQPRSRAEIQRLAGASKNCVRDHLLDFMQEGKVEMTGGRLPLYWWVV